MTATPKDLQDEVGRLREALEDAKEALMDGSGAGVFWRESAVERINKALQTPPESADENQPQACECPAVMNTGEHDWMKLNSDIRKCYFCGLKAQKPQACKHPRIYTAQDGHRFCDECEAYLGEESPPQACEHKEEWYWPSGAKGWLCPVCQKLMKPASNSPQEPKEGERDG